MTEQAAHNAPARHMAESAVGRVANAGRPRFVYAARCSCGFPGDGVTYLKEADAIEALRLLHLERRPFLTEDRTEWLDEYLEAARA